MGVGGVAGMLKKSEQKNGGLNAYDGHSFYLRGRHIKVTFLGRPNKKPGTEFGEQLLCLDGENLTYKKFVNY